MFITIVIFEIKCYLCKSVARLSLSKSENQLTSTYHRLSLRHNAGITTILFLNRTVQANG